MGRARTTDLQIRGIPVSLRERLRRRATRKGVSMSQYVIEQLKADLALPTLDEWLDEVARLPKIDLEARGLSAAQLVREAREEDETEDERLWP
ncbi:MAG TPA: hypothetical protein VFM06_00010 [Candidatus Limnocylindria bacterium]|nr:hypothetical protein [Candidatus Limnocylindria bacterium]